MTDHFIYTEEHELLRQETRRWLSEQAPLAATRKLCDDPHGDAPETWRELAALGWLGMGVAERYGGAGLGAIDQAIVAEETGRVLLPSPVLAQWLAAAVIARAGSHQQCEQWLPGLASGERRASLAHVEPDGAWRAADTRTQLKDGRASGSKAFVWGASTADLLCIPLQSEGRPRIAVVDAHASGVRIASEQTLDPTRRQGRVVLEDVTVEAGALLERQADEVEQTFLPLAWTLLAAESVGAANAALDMTAAYAVSRQQFGKQIGSFQAIKHPLVNVLLACEQARSLVYAAASALDQVDPGAPQLARMAKVAASEAFSFATSRAIQFHGGYGFTDECDAHVYTRRAQASRAAFGDPAHHRRQIADTLLGRQSARNRRTHPIGQERQGSRSALGPTQGGEM